MAYEQNLLSIRAIIARIPDAPPSARITAVLTGIETECTGIVDLILEGDPLKSAAGFALVVNAEKATLRTKIAAARTELIPLIQRWQTAEESARVQKAQLVPDAYAQETRQVFRGMAYPEKLAFVQAATTANDGATMAALLNVPPVLSGLAAQQVDQFRTAFLDRVGPSASDTADELRACVNTALGSADMIGKPTGSTA